LTTISRFLHWKATAFLSPLILLCFCRPCSAQSSGLNWTFVPSTGSTPGASSNLSHNLYYISAASGDFLTNPNLSNGYFPSETSGQYWTDPEHDLHLSIGSSYQNGGWAAGAITVTATDDNEGSWKWTGSSTPPAFQSFLIQPSIRLQAFLPPKFSAALSVSDSINDSWAITSGNASTNVTPHLIQLPTSTSDGTSTVSMDIQSTYGLSLTNGGASASAATCTAWETFTAAPDTRSISISSALGQTYYKDPVTILPDPNIALDGVLTDDTVVNQPITTTVIGVDGPVTSTYTPTIQVNGSYGGDWGLLSSYHWNESIEGQNSSGVFNPLGIDSFAIPTDTSLVGNANPLGKPDHIFLSAYDSYDGAEATGNYYINFHNPLENLRVAPGTTITYTYNLNEPPAVVTVPGQPATSAVPASNGGVTQVQIQPDPVDFQLGSQIVSGFVATGGAVYLATAEEPPLWLVGLLAAASAALSDVPGPPAATSLGFTCNTTQLSSDLTIQNEYQAGTIPNGTPLSSTMSASMAAEMATNPNTSNLLNGDYGAVTVVPRIYSKVSHTQWIGDGYGTSGYYGQASATTAMYVANILQGYWDFTPNAGTGG